MRGAQTGIFYGKGEVCAAGSRLLVEKSVHPQVIEQLAEGAKKLTPGDPLDKNTRLGALVSKKQQETVLSYIKKGVDEALQDGVLAGYPVVDVKATLFDGSYHDVDSNENAFKMAAIFAFKDGMRAAQPVLLEPIMAVEVETPPDFMGNVVGDLSSRRGIIQGMEDVIGVKVIKAEVPLGEMFGYSTALRSATQGRATYTMEFKHYAEAPKSVADAVITARSK